MTARAESIMSAVVTTVTGLTTTGANVRRGPAYPHESASLPALGVFMGQDSPLRELQTNVLDWQLQIIIETAATASPADGADAAADVAIETTANAIRAEVHAALCDGSMLGLVYVEDVIPGRASRPELRGDGSLVYSSQEIEFLINYRTARDDLEAGP